MARRHVDLRRAEILAAAATVVTREGFARTRVQDVAAELGISTSLVFYHFNTKDLLLTGAFELAAERELDLLDRAMRGGGSAVSRLRAVLDVMLPADSARGWLRDVDACVAGMHSAEIEDACRRLAEARLGSLLRVIEDGLVTGEFRCDDPAEAASRILVQRDGLAIATHVRGTLTRSRAARWLAEHAADLVGVPPERLSGGREVPAQQRPQRARHPS